MDFFCPANFVIIEILHLSFYSSDFFLFIKPYNHWNCSSVPVWPYVQFFNHIKYCLFLWEIKNVYLFTDLVSFPDNENIYITPIFVTVFVKLKSFLLTILMYLTKQNFKSEFLLKTIIETRRERNSVYVFLCEWKEEKWNCFGKGSHEESILI